MFRGSRGSVGQVRCSLGTSSGETSPDTDAQKKRDEQRDRHPPSNPVKLESNDFHDQIPLSRRLHDLRLHFFFILR
jgi:hypothetical protein